MQTRLLSLATLTFILLAGCSDNDLGVGTMDAATGSGGAVAGSGGTGSGGLSTVGSGGTTAGTGGIGGTAAGPCSQAMCLTALFQTCIPDGACAVHAGGSPSAVFNDICYANGVTVLRVGSYSGPNTTDSLSVARNGVRCYSIEQLIPPGASSGSFVITDGNGNEIATAVVADKATDTVTVTCKGQSTVTVAGACLHPVNASPTCTLNECPTSYDGGTGGVDGGTNIEGSDAGAVCDPLAPAPKPIALADILGIGKSANGTIYVADQSGSTQRVFVSDASGTLVRQHTSGGGSSSDENGIQYIFTVTDPASPFVLEVYVPKSGAIRMGVLQGTLPDRKSFVIGQEGEELTVLASSAIANMPLRNFPGTMVAEYIATLPDGQLILVTRPADDVSYADFRVFLGPVGAVAERKVFQVSRALDGGSTHVIFDLDGAQADAYFRIVLVDASFAPGPATLTVGDVTTTLTRQSTLPAATYVCL
jgi:hypothetical protein